MGWQDAPLASDDGAPKWASAPLDHASNMDFARPIADVRAEIAKIPEGPQRDAAMKAWADAYVAKERADLKPMDAPGVDLRRAGDFVRNAARGTIIGSYADELNAATNAAIHSMSGGRVGAPYDESVAYQRAVDRALDKEDPVGSTVTKVAGGVASGAPIAKAVLKTGKTLMGRIWRGGALGGTYGTVSGFGEGEGDFANRAEKAGQGAAFGVPFGMALPPVANALTYAGGKAVEAFAPQLARWRNGPEAAAETVLAQKMRASGQNPLGIAADLADGQAAARVGRGASYAELPEMIGDTGNGMQRLMGSVYRAGGEAGEMVKGRLDARQRGPQNPYAPQEGEPAGQMSTVLDALDRALGIKTAKSAHRTEQQVLQDMKKEADVLYDAARRGSEPFDLQPALDAMALKMQQYPPPFAAELSKALGLFVNPTHHAASAAHARITSGLERASGATSEVEQKAAADLVLSGIRAIEKLTEKSNRPFAVDDIRRFDYAKRALDSMIDKASPTMQRDLIEFKNQLLARVHEGDRNQIYKRARETYVEGNAQKDALDLGRNALREKSDVTIDQYRALDEAQRKMFRVGLREGYLGRVGTMDPGTDVTKLFQQQRMVDILNEAIPGRTRPERFGEYMRRQQRMVQARNKAIGGTETAERIGDDLDFSASVVSQMWNRFKNAPSLKGAVIESIGAGLQSAFAFRQDVAKSLARRLLETDPSNQAAILAAVQKRMGPDRFADFADMLDRNLYTLTKTEARQASSP